MGNAKRQRRTTHMKNDRQERRETTDERRETSDEGGEGTERRREKRWEKEGHERESERGEWVGGGGQGSASPHWPMAVERGEPRGPNVVSSLSRQDGSALRA